MHLSLSMELLRGVSPSTQNVANKLGNNRKVIAWEGEVEIFENGYIRGNGACKEFSPSTNGQPNARTLSSTEIPQGRNELPTFAGANRTQSVILGSDVLNYFKSRGWSILNKKFTNLSDIDKEREINKSAFLKQ